MIRTKLKAFILPVLLVPYVISMMGMFTSYFSFFYKTNTQSAVLSVEDDELELLVLSPTEFEATRWTDGKREFERAGKMFDVARIEFREGSYFIYCENDFFEDLLLNYLNAPGSKTKSSQIFQAQFFEPLNEFTCKETIPKSVEENLIAANLYTSVTQELTTPPPRIS